MIQNLEELDELWPECRGIPPTSRDMRGQDIKRREAPTSRATEQIRSPDQRENCGGSGARSSTGASRLRRRGDRVSAFAAVARVRKWQILLQKSQVDLGCADAQRTPKMAFLAVAS